MKNYLQLRDTVDFKPIEIMSQERKDNYFGSGQPNRPLIVKIAATHAGLITRNNGLYLPDKMRKGASTFTSQYNKPIQVHHSDHQDPVGRILKAEYVDMSANVQQTIINKKKDFFTNFSQDNFARFINGKMPFIESVNFICDYLNKKDSLLDDPDYQGLGFIKLTAQISDPDAIQKILDGRYLTGSVGLTTDSAVCSVCKQDWTGDSGRCEHSPGKTYDGVKAFMITGDLTYDEYSFVNTPADRHSRVMEVNINGITDSVIMDDSVGKTIAVNLITDNIQEDNMKSVAEKLLSDARFAILGTEHLQLILDSIQDEKVFTEKWPFTDELDFAVAFEEDLDKQAIAKTFTIALDDARLAAIKVIRPSMKDETIKLVLDANPVDADAFYVALNDGEWADYSESDDEAIATFLVEHPEDAKLSSAQRKRLPGSSFCGPNKSFPVPDCAHVTAARRLIGRASVSAGTKSKILACVSRKASALGCDAKAKKDQEEAAKVTVDSKSKEDCACKETDAKIKELTDKFEADKAEYIKTAQLNFDTVNDKLKIAEDKLVTAEKELSLVREEYAATQNDLTQMADQLFTLQTQSTNYLVDNVMIHRVLSGEVIEDQNKAKEELLALGEDKIRDKLTEITGKVDIKKITDSINSGLTNSPNKSVGDPTGNMTKKVYDKTTVAQIEAEYVRIQFGGNSAYGKGKDAADRFKQDMQVRGLLPVG